MVRVAITTRKIKNPNYNEIYNAISDDWLIYFNKLKIEPILITDKQTNPIEYFKKAKCKSLFLLNGENTKIKLKKNKIIKVTPRDYIEFKLLNYCLKNKLPILGVCRGHQFINLCFGGKLKKIAGKSNIILPNGRTKKIGFFKNPKVLPNSTIMVTFKEEKEKKGKFTENFSQIFGILSSTITTILLANRL